MSITLHFSMRTPGCQFISCGLWLPAWQWLSAAKMHRSSRRRWTCLISVERSEETIPRHFRNVPVHLTESQQLPWKNKKTTKKKSCFRLGCLGIPGLCRWAAAVGCDGRYFTFGHRLLRQLILSKGLKFGSMAAADNCIHCWLWLVWLASSGVASNVQLCWRSWPPPGWWSLAQPKAPGKQKGWGWGCLQERRLAGAAICVFLRGGSPDGADVRLFPQ